MMKEVHFTFIPAALDHHFTEADIFVARSSNRLSFGSATLAFVVRHRVRLTEGRCCRAWAPHTTSALRRTHHD